MASFGRRPRRYRTVSHHKLHPLAIVAICVGAALIISLIVGNLLKIFLNEDVYNRLVSQNDTPTVTDPIETALPEVQAKPFVLGDPTDALPSAVSVNLGASDGSLHYRSPVSSQFSIEQNEKVDLSVSMSALTSTYVSGIFYPQAFRQDADMQYATALRERALLNEFFRFGGDDVLLVGVDVSPDNLPALEAYVSAIKQETSHATVGIAVPLSVAQSENGWEILSTLLKSFDFCALDVRNTATPNHSDHEEFLNSLSFYLEQYDMRLLLSQTQAELISAISKTDINNYQIAALIPVATEDDDAQG